MGPRHKITINGMSFHARHNDLLLDAALSNGIDMPHDCRAGHCGTCCVRLVSGAVQGGQGSEPGVVHACQCRIVGDAEIEHLEGQPQRTVEGVVSALRPLSADVMEVGVRTARALPYLPGQYAHVRFHGFPGRPFSITHPLPGHATSNSVWFHIRRMEHGVVTSALGKRITPGHRVLLTGPFGSAHFRPNLRSRIVLVATSTGFAPIWAIAVAALREKPDRRMMVIAGGRNIDSLYMAPALAQLASFPNVIVVPVCSREHTRLEGQNKWANPGRPTDYLPLLLPGDVVYACGAPEMVAAVKAITTEAGAICYADPFMAARNGTPEEGVLARAVGWISLPAMRQVRQLALDRTRRQPPIQAYRLAEAKVRRRRDVHRA